MRGAEEMGFGNTKVWETGGRVEIAIVENVRYWGTGRWIE